MRVLSLPRYGRLGASSRLRTFQYLPALRDAGFDVDVSPLFPDEYISGLYSGRVSLQLVVAAYWHRLNKLLTARRHDLVWIEKEALPWLPASVALTMIGSKVPLMVDYDDALFHRYDQHRSWFVRTVLGRKIDAVMRRADLVTVGNGYLGQRARSIGCHRVEWLPTVVDLSRYVQRGPRVIAKRRAVVGWIGSPKTAHYLRQIVPAVTELSRRMPIRCIAIGARPDQLAGTPFEPVLWSEATEVGLLQELDVGVMPLPDAPWERGKCGYKLIQYMACGVPVVASPVGVNASIVKHGQNGFLARSASDWADYLTRLLRDDALRTNMGTRARESVEARYSLQAQVPRLRDMLQNVSRVQSA